MKVKYASNECTPNMNFNECELAILRHAVDENEKIKGQRIAMSEDITKMIQIVEDFLAKKRCVCYGGTAINNILPKQDQFYNREYDVPDYDFFSPNALDHAKELADLFYKAGYLDVEAKSGVHHGTYKVFVNFIPMADITYMHPELFETISKEAIVIAGIKYTPPNFLRMSMFLELSRPEGDTSRWEKVLKRLNLLNKHYPLNVNANCHAIDFQRKMDENVEQSEQIYYIVRDTFIREECVFFGGYANSIYSEHMPKSAKRFSQKIPDFDVLSNDIEKTAMIVQEQLMTSGFNPIKLVKHDAVGEIVPERIEIKYGNDTLAFIYEPIACHNYNTIILNDQEVHVATIDTILSFYLALFYANAHNYPKKYLDRLLCTAMFLFNLEQKTRLSQDGVLKRFVPKCIGVQDTLENIRAQKAEKFTELQKKKGTREYEEWFLKYIPNEMRLHKKTSTKRSKSRKTMRKKNTVHFSLKPFPLFVQQPKI